MRLLLATVALSLAVPVSAQSAPGGRIQGYTAPDAALSSANDGKRKDRVPLQVDAASTKWMDSSVRVAAGDTLTFTATGAVELAGHTLAPDGMTRGWRDMLRSFPVDTANAGALVGRIGENAAAVPFAIGSSATVIATQSGTLFLRINASSEMPAAGTVTVDLHITSAASVAQAKISAVQPSPFATLAPTTLDALPRRVTDQDGAPGDAVNFVLLGTEQQVRNAFPRAGWAQVDADTGSAVLHGLLSTLEHKPYVEVPMSRLYLFGRTQDLGFARASAITVASERHHLRCWKTSVFVNGVPLWAGAATHDVGLERDQRNGHMTHRIAPEIDLERDFLRDSFLESGAAVSAAYFTPLVPVRQAQTATGGSYSTDGRVLLMQLR